MQLQVQLANRLGATVIVIFVRPTQHKGIGGDALLGLAYAGNDLVKVQREMKIEFGNQATPSCNGRQRLQDS